ncbi:SIMPL domain-containing protein [Desulfopila sp. IMCC35008]|uniref:SIMPL domain-containing protein n=1 Tax=Desulfopila sp. IMCC35008 TaxID=2653858 RepID=UPI0013D20DC4|nr:SIMPL domain-containing protein [Desulfopila sp. IMCC35008]
MRTFFLLCIILLNVSAVFAEPVRTITVYNDAVAILPADYSRIHAQLKVVADSMEKSRSSVQSDMIKLAQKMAALGIEPADITVSTITQGIEYGWESNSRVVNGYFSAGTLQIKVNVLEHIHEVYKELSRYPSLSINYTEYDRNDKKQQETRLLQQALLSAREKAAIMAAALDAKLGAVHSIQETSLPASGPQPFRAAKAMSEVPAVTMGSVTVRAEVTVVFELE